MSKYEERKSTKSTELLKTLFLCLAILQLPHDDQNDVSEFNDRRHIMIHHRLNDQ